MKIILFRHGEKQEFSSVGGKEKLVSLTNKGISQITKLANTLKTRFPELINLKYLFTSPYARTIQSAEIVRSILKINELSVHNEFKEFSPVVNFSHSKEDMNLLTLAMQDHNWIPQQTKISFNKAISVFQEKLKEIYFENQDKTILVSNHSAIVRNMIYDLEPKFRPSDDLIRNSSIHEAGYTILNYDGNNFIVEEFNIYDYLENL
jgi:broad specificity phosphatase PhoE